ncbi:pyridoxamine 5'-phosphate oxidase family protein [Polaromonas sp.]|uniref:HugZ family pyridoxamine 5'-phosphate oxidase n=1 Tax=Polaromonas sp. TaxID=1869339 RepID=UPI0013B82979|nr:pyridoxamine 5'-phosphate oxidase family protein [Polaromonas sp.]NDP62947.1 pyridoxamine 5'-phosphate oxidase [Polaromonas sp.]
MLHETRLTLALRALLHSRRVAALGTLDDDGNPFVSMVPYAMEPSLGFLVIHVSGLAAHTGNLQARPNVSVLVMQAEVEGEPVHALSRVTLDGWARVLEAGTPAWETCQSAYVKRFPEAQFMTQLGDFRFVAIEPKGARQVAGFGAARSIDEEEVRRTLGPTGQ